MSIAFLIGRIAFVAIFLVSGIFNLMDRAKLAALIESKFAIPPSMADAAAKAQAATGLPPYELLAIAISSVEIIFAALIIFNVITRFSALVLLVYTAVTAYLFYDFWNMSEDARALNLTLALQSLSIIGGLIILFAIGAWQPSFRDDEDYDGV